MSTGIESFQVEDVQSDWHQFISLLSERKLSVENQADEWRVISQQTTMIAKNMSAVESRLSDSCHSIDSKLSPSQKIRDKVDKTRQLSEKVQNISWMLDQIFGFFLW